MMLRAIFTFPQTDADADGGEDQAQGRDNDEENAPDADAHEDVVNVAAAVLVRRRTGMIFRQSCYGISTILIYSVSFAGNGTSCYKISEQKQVKF